MLQVWSAEMAHWDAVFLRSCNFGQKHLGNFPLLLIYSAYGDLVGHAKNASHLYSRFRFFPNSCHINHLSWSLQVSWEVGREGTGIHTLQMSKMHPREVKQLAQGHTAFQREPSLETLYSKLLALDVDWLTNTDHCPAGLHQKPNWKIPRSEILPLDVFVFFLLINIWLRHHSCSFGVMFIILVTCCSLCHQPDACRNQRMEEWLGEIFLWSVFKWNPIYKIHFTSFDVQLTN